ncbi:MAG TPA: hypothetical protein VFM14_18430 [Gemmatimonadales bacterium]|nr:hypothetical protein [Gemmatimonadales bacterium]
MPSRAAGRPSHATAVAGRAAAHVGSLLDDLGQHFMPRDFMKLAQLMVNEGKWAGRQIVSPDWARKSTAALRDLSRVQQYGWLWNSPEYSYDGRKVRGFFAGGNGGQIFMDIPAAATIRRRCSLRSGSTFRSTSFRL